MLDESVTGVEAARLLGVSRKTVYRWAAEGRLPIAHRTLGGHARFLRSDIEAVAAVMVAAR